MRKNRITLLVTLVLVIAAGILWYTSSNSTLRRNATDFAINDTALVNRIFMADKNNKQVLLEKKQDGLWYVDGKNLAHQLKVHEFLRTLQDIQVRNPVPLTARDNVIKRMSAIAKKIEIYQVVPRINLFGKLKLFPHEKNVKTYYIGDVTQDNQGTFMLMEGADDPYVVNLPGFRGFVASRYSTDPDEWRDYTVFSTMLGDIRSVRVEFPQSPAESYEFDVDDSKTIRLKSLATSQEIVGFDTIRTLNFLTGFQDIRFEALLENQLEKTFIDSVLATTPKTIITVTDRMGATSVAKIFPKKGFSSLYQEDGAALEPVDLDRAYALVNNGEDFVLIQYFVFDRITRPLSYFTRKGNL